MTSLPSDPTYSEICAPSGWVFRPLATNGNTWQRPALRVVPPPAGGDTQPSTRPIVPGVTGLQNVDAALVYAKHLGHVLPVVAGSKSPGSLVGNGWPGQSTRDNDQIRLWWSQWPDAGIALHTGPTALVAFDLDTDELPDELAWLEDGAVQYSRNAKTGSQRGHYIFHSPGQWFVSGKIALSDGTTVGEIRSGNTVIVLAPTPHAKASKCGQYRWRAADVGREIPPLPDKALAYVRPLGTARAGGRMSVSAPSAEVQRARQEWTANERPKPLESLCNSIAKQLAGTRDHTRDMLRIAASEARLGFYPLATAEKRIEAAMRESYALRGEPEEFDQHDFSRLVRNGVGYALSRSLDEIREEATGEYGSGNRNGHAIGSALSRSGITMSTNAPTQQPDSNGNSDADRADFDSAVETETRRIRIREAARKAISREQWNAPDDQGDLAYQIDHPQPDPGYLVSELIPARGFVLINAQYKVGKSTLVSVNLTRALVTGQPFLGRFATNLGDGENVAVWNLEVDQGTLTGWLQRTGMDRSAQQRVYPMCLRGNRSVDFDSDPAVEWTVRWLRDRNVTVWIIDPLSKLYRGDDESNREFNQWWLRAEDIAARAGVRAVVIVHHTGHSETAADRARGASSMMGNPDVLVTYRHGGRHGAPPPDSKRWLSAIGRNVAVGEFEIDFNAATGELYATGSTTTRAGAARRKAAIRVWEHLQITAAAVAKTALLDAVGLPSKGKGASESGEVLDYGEQQGWLVTATSGRSKLYSCGASTPPMDERSAGWMASAVNIPVIGGNGGGRTNAP